MITDNASSEVIEQTEMQWKEYVRLFFRPRTPTQFHNEGYRPKRQRTFNSHCPFPIYFLLDSKNLLTRKDVLFSDGTLAAAGGIRERSLSPRLTQEEGLACVYKYSELSRQPVSETSAEVMNELTRSDPFYISCIFGSYYENKDLQTADGVVDAFAYEISDRGSGFKHSLAGVYFPYSLPGK